MKNPHIFTHLFHGGVIMSTRRLDYDAEASEDVVRSLMQAQHKAVMKDLKSGSFTEQIELHLKDDPNLLPLDATDQDPIDDAAPKHMYDHNASGSMRVAAAAEETAPDMTQPVSVVEDIANIHSSAPGTAEPATAQTDSQAARPAAASNVVVSRPAVIVGAPPTVVGNKPPAREAKQAPKQDSLFGQGLISEKSLDEVILAYLSDDAEE